MARTTDLEQMSPAELKALQARIERLKLEKREADRVALRAKITELAREYGFDIKELIGQGRGRNGSVAAKYRDPQNPENTWTGRGRMPRWMAAAMKGSRKTKEDFLIG
jgi:DNA-binding protein H-NS